LVLVTYGLYLNIFMALPDRGRKLNEKEIAFEVTEGLLDFLKLTPDKMRKMLDAYGPKKAVKLGIMMAGFAGVFGAGQAQAGDKVFDTYIANKGAETSLKELAKDNDPEVKTFLDALKNAREASEHAAEMTSKERADLKKALAELPTASEMDRLLDLQDKADTLDDAGMIELSDIASRLRNSSQVILDFLKSLEAAQPGEEIIDDGGTQLAQNIAGKTIQK
jgi:hypothetical protein